MAIPWGAEVRVEASAAVADTRGMLRSVLLAGRALEFLAGFAAVIWAGGKAVHGPIRRYFERRYRVPIRVETSVTGDCEHGRRIRNRTTVWVTDEFVWTDVAIKLELLPGILHFSIVGAYVVLAVSELCVIDWLLSAPCNLLD